MNTFSPPPVPQLEGEALSKFPQIWGGMGSPLGMGGVGGQVLIRAVSLMSYEF
jgi:hypothetical protein